MRLAVRKSEPLNFLKCFPILLFSLIGSFSLLLSPQIKFALVLLLGMIVLLNLGRMRISNKMTLPYVILILVLYLWNNAFFNLRSVAYMQKLMLFPFMVLFAAQGGYPYEGWSKLLLKALRLGYLVYIGFTIAMFLNGNLIEFVCNLFPAYRVTLLNQYSMGAMPGLTHHYSTNGMLVSVGTIVYACYAMCYKKKKDILLFLAAIAALLLTGKRAHVVFGLFALYVTYYAYNAGNKQNRLFKSVGILIVSAMAFFLASYFVPGLAVVVGRFIDAAESGDATLGRTTVWLKALETVSQHPLFGIGWEQFSQSGGWNWNIHNIYIQLLVEVGVVGFLAYCGWFVFFLVQSWKNLTYLRTHRNLFHVTDTCVVSFSLAMQILFLMYGFTGNPLYDQAMFVPYFAACAITQYYRRKLKNYGRGMTNKEWMAIGNHGVHYDSESV